MTPTPSRVDTAVTAIEQGGFAVVVDEAAGRGAEGVLVLAAQAMTAERMAFMIRHTSGVIAVPLEGQRLDALHLPLMVAEPAAAAAAFTVSVDAHQGGSAERRPRRPRRSSPRPPRLTSGGPLTLRPSG